LSIRKTAVRIAVAAAGLALLACASPAVTGIKVHMQNGEFQDAIRLADSVIASGDSLDAELWLWRGKAMGNLREWDGSAMSFNRAYELSPQLAPQLADYWFVFYNSAAIKVEANDLNAARADLEDGRTIVPTRPEYDQMLGDIALNNGDYVLAIDHFERAWTISQPLIASYESMLETATGDQIAAIQEALDGAIGGALLSIYNAGMLHKSQAAGADTPEEAAAHLDSARDLLIQAVELDPTNADVLNLLAQVYLLQQNFDEAMAVFDRALAGVDQGVSEGWLTEEDAVAIRGEIMMTRGVALLETQQYDEAIAQLEAARSYIGDDYVLLGNLAQAYIVKENYEAALSLLEVVITLPGLTPEELGNAWYMEFATFTQMERDTEAATALEQALELVPANPDWWEYLASTYSRLGRRNDAIRAMEQAQMLRNPTRN
jgi:tetratricopeptide (TPR) repeat protein